MFKESLYFKNITLHKICLSLLLLFIIGISTYCVSQKQAFFLDEVCSFLQSNIAFMSLGDLINNLKYESLAELNESTQKLLWIGEFNQQEFYSHCCISGEKSGFNFFSIYLIESFNVHPPLYHFILHAISSITKSENLILLGFLINTIALLLSCLLIFHIVCNLSDNKWIALISVAYYGLSYEYNNTATFFRMYPLIGFWLILLLYYHIQFEKKNWELGKYELSKVGIVEFLAMFTHYFAFFYILPLFLLSVYRNRCNKPLLKRIFKINVITGAIYLIIWPQSIFHMLFTNRGHDVRGNILSNNIISRIHGYLWNLDKSLFGGCRVILLIFIFLILTTILLKFKKNILQAFRSKNKHIYLMLIVPALLYYIIVVKVSPWISPRYVSPVMPIISIFVILAIYKSLSFYISNEHARLIILSGYVFSTTITWMCFCSLEHLYPITEEKKTFIEKYSKDPAIILSADDIPIFIEIPANYTHSKYITTDEKNLESYLPSKLVEDEYVLYVSEFIKTDNISRLLEQKGYTYKRISYKTQFHDTYLLKKL